MTSMAAFGSALQVIAALLIVVALYLALLVFVIVCIVVADLVYEGARLFRDNTEGPNPLDAGAAYEAENDRGWLQRLRHKFQH